jgi:hypothetical protein
MIDWANIVGMIGIPLALAAWGRIESAQSRARHAEEKRLAEAKAVHDSLHKRITNLITEFAEYREKVARDYATREMLLTLERGLVSQLTRLDEKIDRLLEGRH